jgi:hypothetical protein
MSYQLHISNYAIEQINNAADWFEKEKAGLGKLFVDDFFLSIDYIILNPFACQKRYKQFRIKFLEKFSFGIHYKINGKTIAVMAVFHTSQSDENWFK